MKGLLYKDFLCVSKQAWVLYALVIIFTFLPFKSVSFLNSLGFFYTVLISSTALAYDERSGWKTYEKMLPYSPLSVILTKCIMCYVPLLILTVLSSLINTFVFGVNIMPIFASFFITLIAFSVYLPICYKFGTIKGKYVYMLFAVAMMFVLNLLFSVPIELSSLLNDSATWIIATLAAIGLNVLSVFVSIKIYCNTK